MNLNIELFGFDDSGPDGVPTNPWWARATVVMSEAEISISSRRCATAWEAVDRVTTAATLIEWRAM